MTAELVRVLEHAAFRARAESEDRAVATPELVRAKLLDWRGRWPTSAAPSSFSRTTRSRTTGERGIVERLRRKAIGR